MRTLLASLELGDDVELRVLSSVGGQLLVLAVDDEEGITEAVLDRDEATRLRATLDTFLGGAR
ncbi:hypothetical protein QOZ88_05800 [Blastococcus sp. BMG 814]|uniref:Uncharacterized protein n=1 Tax=Blastococcus carthaginiensis TaxID=3050034 RepID=A0ABT9I991_9ACTN|nr:hypothetical protein [Blastococcus carthaginiensis]MDP5182143.1 hypothetical protein [Blastococcus carthaginiensis]